MAAFPGLCHHERVTTVLIVDDHPSFRSSAHALLEAEGYEIIGEAEDGESAIEAAGRLHRDIVLLDVQLPDIDGFEVARRLTSDGNGPNVVLVSSRELTITARSSTTVAHADSFRRTSSRVPRLQRS